MCPIVVVGRPQPHVDLGGVMERDISQLVFKKRIGKPFQHGFGKVCCAVHTSSDRWHDLFKKQSAQPWAHFGVGNRFAHRYQPPGQCLCDQRAVGAIENAHFAQRITLNIVDNGNGRMDKKIARPPLPRKRPRAARRNPPPEPPRPRRKNPRENPGA